MQPWTSVTTSSTTWFDRSYRKAYYHQCIGDKGLDCCHVWKVQNRCSCAHWCYWLVCQPSCFGWFSDTEAGILFVQDNSRSHTNMWIISSMEKTDFLHWQVNCLLSNTCVTSLESELHHWSTSSTHHWGDAYLRGCGILISSWDNH